MAFTGELIHHNFLDSGNPFVCIRVDAVFTIE